MMRWVVIALSCLVVVASSLSQVEPPKTAQKQSVQGKVVEAKSGQPIRKVNVVVVGGSEQSFGSYSSITTEDGTFTIQNLNPGRYTVTLERTGFAQTGAGRGQATFTLQPGQSLGGLVFKMQAAGVIAGKIVDVDGDPIAGASVNATMTGTVSRIAGRRPEGYAETNDLGEYRIGNLRPGKYLISATAPQRTPVVHVGENGQIKEQLTYAPSTYYPGTLDKSRAIAVEVHAGTEASATFGVLMTHVYRVSGTVAGVPSGGISRELSLGTRSSDSAQSAELSEGGRFEFQNVLPGTYVAVVVIFKDREMLGRGEAEIQILRVKPSIEVDRTDVEGVQLQAEPGGQIRGMFRLDSGEKFDWTQLMVGLQPIEEDLSEMSSRAATYSRNRAGGMVNSDGTFEIKNLPGGNFQLVVGAKSNQMRDYYTKAVIFGGRDVADSGFGVNGDVYLDVVMSAKGATIEGNVVDNKGQSVAYGTVAIVPNFEHRARPDSYQQEQTDEHGHFIARGLNPGSYVVLAFEESREDILRPEFLKTYAAQGEKVEVEEGTRKSVTAKIIRADTEAQ